MLGYSNIAVVIAAFCMMHKLSEAMRAVPGRHSITEPGVAFFLPQLNKQPAQASERLLDRMKRDQDHSQRV